MLGYYFCLIIINWAFRLGTKNNDTITLMPHHRNASVRDCNITYYKILYIYIRGYGNECKNNVWRQKCNYWFPFGIHIFCILYSDHHRTVFAFVWLLFRLPSVPPCICFGNEFRATVYNTQRSGRRRQYIILLYAPRGSKFYRNRVSS